MHPPPFRLGQRLSDWPACWLELLCCNGVVLMPVRLLVERHGDMTFADVLARLRCHRCGIRPEPVFLCAGQSRTQTGGAPPDWAIELVASRHHKIIASNV